MPGDLKIRNGTRKYILKHALRGMLPDRNPRPQKEGFSIPMKNWLRRELQPLMDATCSRRTASRARGLVEPSEVARLIQRALRRAREPRARAVQPDGVRAVGRIGCRQVLTGS